LETPAAAKTRIRHCYNRPQTIRRLLSQKPILSREERQTTTTTTNKNFHTQVLKFQQLSHTANKIRTHTDKPSNKQTRKTHQKNTKVPNKNTPPKKQKQGKLISLQTQEEEEEEEEQHHHNNSNSQNTNP
jgi:hypothetical protein